MHPNQQLVERFYHSFSQRDHAGMRACYSPAAAFTDAVFALQGREIGAMWHMLCEGGTDLEIRFRDVRADERRGTAQWEARYTFSSSGRKVHNLIAAEFAFQDGLIVQHQDRFDFWRWSRQALGPAGWLFGWTPLLQQQVRRTARRRLDRFIAAHPEYRG